MRFAYADPPYLGCGKLYKEHHPDALDCDNPAWHQSLIDRLCRDFKDGWVMSLSSPSLKTLLPMCPSDCRVGAWVKPFAIFKPNVNPAYAWEPFIWRGGRKRNRTQPTVRDWVSANITLKRGLTGAKPTEFLTHILSVIGFELTDEIVDLFPGTNSMQSLLNNVGHKP